MSKMLLLIRRACRARRGALIYVAVALTTIAVYWPARQFQFVNYDDDDYVYQNRQVQRGLTLPGIVWAFTTRHASNWHPLTWLSHMLDWQLWDGNAGAHHLVNLLCHGANALLLLAVLHRMTGSLWRSALVAALFALHPLRVESVAWVAERKDVLSAMFWMLTMWAYIRYVEQPGWKKYLLTLGLCALGLMAKPMLVTLPFALLLLDYWPLGRTRWAKPATGHSVAKPTGYLLQEKVPFLILTAASCVVTVWAQQRSITVLERLPVSSRLGNAAVSYVRYIGKTLWPTDLAVFYPYERWPASTVLLAAVVLAGVTALVIARARRQPHLLTGWLWYLGTLVPVIGLVQVGLQSIADRYTYLPSIGLFVMLAWSVPERVTATRKQTVMVASAAAIVLIACAVASRLQLRHWRNSLTLFRHALAVTRNNYVALSNLGAAMLEQGKLPEVIQHSERALQIKPDAAEAHNNLGSALFQSGNVQEAIAHLQRALQLKPDVALTHYNLGLALKQTGRLAEAVEHYRQALRLDPDYADAYNNLGVALAAQGKRQEATQCWEKTLRIDPQHADAQYNLGLALLQQGDVLKAIEHLTQALQLRPNHAETHNNLGLAFLAVGKTDEAIPHFRQALRLRPDFAEAHRNWGHALELLGKLPEAIAQYEQTLRLQPDHIGALNDLGNVLLRTGQVQEAIARFESALRNNPDDLASLNNLAWALAVSPPTAGGDPARSVTLAEHACELGNHRIPAHLDTLAAAYAATGRFNDAVATAEKAVELARAAGQQDVAAEIESRLQLYREGKAYQRLQASR